MPWSSSCNYIGFVLDQRLNFKPRIYTTRKKYREAENKLFSLLAQMVIYLLKINRSYTHPFFFRFSFKRVVSRYLWQKPTIKLLIEFQNYAFRLIYDIP